ncbi:MAG: glucose-6-phosphate isomerase family protein [Candidatus Nezhaarchaeales archaeon]
MKILLGFLSLEFMNGFKELRVNGKTYKPSIRLVEDLKPVLLSEVDESLSRKPAYFMFRGVCRQVDEQLFTMFCLRYDITVIPPRVLGKEHVKTFGHYHPTPYGSQSYPEVYEVLYGEAHYILQREDDGVIRDVLLIKAKEGDKVLIPPNYGHVTINPSSEPLIMANLVSSTFKSIYDAYRLKRGAAFYELIDGSLIPNTNYKGHLEIREVNPVKVIPNAPPGDIYTSFIRSPVAYRFLNSPALTPRVW